MQIQISLAQNIVFVTSIFMLAILIPSMVILDGSFRKCINSKIQKSQIQKFGQIPVSLDEKVFLLTDHTF